MYFGDDGILSKLIFISVGMNYAGAAPSSHVLCRNTRVTAALPGASRTPLSTLCKTHRSQSRTWQPCSVSISRCGRRRVAPRSQASDEQPDSPVAAVAAEVQKAVGEDAALFRLQDQSVSAWGIFTVLLTVVLAALYAVWISPNGGLADDYVGLFKQLSSNTEAVIVAQLAVFALFHSGLAYLRPAGEKLIGGRAYRVIFALVSLPLAVVPVAYFINHRYSGTPLWDLRGLPYVHEAVWVLSFVSFIFLYPSTFNLLEVAAVDEPKLHLWDTGVIRITRHPQALGQLIWCLAHTLWIGNSFMVSTSLALMVHHAFGCWHGDFRLRRQWGKDFEEVKSRTSIMPFQAISEGRQQLPKDYYKEFLRPSYIVLVAFTCGAYWAHPLMQRASYWLNW